MPIELPSSYESILRQLARKSGTTVEEYLIELIEGELETANIALLPPHQLTVIAGTLVLLSDRRNYAFKRSSGVTLLDHLRLAVNRKRRHDRFEVDGVKWLRQTSFNEILDAHADPNFTILFSDEMAKDVSRQLEKILEVAEQEKG
jgi:hypothetical protein